MEKTVKEDILEIINKVIDVLKIKEEHDVIELKGLSDHTTHDASIYQDADSVEIAVLVYALYKLLERGIDFPKSIYTQVINQFGLARNNLTADNLSGYNQNIKNLFELIRKVDKKVGLYVQEVIDNARIKKGSNLFSHGLSSKRVAEMMGVTQWELLKYVGHTQIIENYPVEGWPESKRWDWTREIFNL